MRTTMTIFVLTLATILAFAPVANAQIDTYTFNKTSGKWNFAANWDGPGPGPPKAGDKAIIPSGKTCTIVDADQAAEIIDVQGTLEIKDRQLRVGKAGGTTTSTIGGTLKMIDDNGALDTRLRVRNWVTFNGSGLITGRKTTAGGGREGLMMREDFTADQGVVFGSGLTVAGSLSFNLGVENNGTMKVDDSKDTMQIGGTTAWRFELLELKGTGEIQVSAGKLEFWWVKKWGAGTTPKWVLSGGTIQLTSTLGGAQSFLNLPVVFDMSGGTFDVDKDFSTTGDFTWTGGTIKVKDGEAATFKQPPA